MAGPGTPAPGRSSMRTARRLSGRPWPSRRPTAACGPGPRSRPGWRPGSAARSGRTDGAEQPVAGLVAVELGQDRAAPALVVDVAEQVQALDHAAELAQGARERHGTIPDLEHAHGGVGMD